MKEKTCRNITEKIIVFLFEKCNQGRLEVIERKWLTLNILHIISNCLNQNIKNLL